MGSRLFGAAALAALAACSFRHGVEPGAGGPGAIIDDSAADFAAGTAGDLAIDPAGLLVPDAFARGGLHARGYATMAVTATTTWADLTPAALGTMFGERYGELPVTDWGNGHPLGLGLAGEDNSFTVVYDGEIFLQAGTTTLQLVCDDSGFFDLDLGGGQVVTLRAQASDGNGGQMIDVAAPAEGWYPIRGAMTEIGGNAKLILSTIPAGGAAQPITADRLRARVTEAQGVTVVGSPYRILSMVQPTSSIEPGLVERDFAGGTPAYDLGLGPTDYSLRYAGQVRIDSTGSYVIAVDPGAEAGDYARVFLDGALIAQHWPGLVDKPSATLDLTAGWHDIVLDYANYQNTAHISLTLQPVGGAQATIPADHLRPVRTGGLLAAALGTQMASFPDATGTGPTTTAIALPLAAPPGATIDYVDFLFYLQTTPRTDVTLSLEAAAAVDPTTLPATPAYESTYDYFPVRTMLAGADATSATAWQASFEDSVFTGYGGQIDYSTLVASYHGGPEAPFAQDMTYTSAPHATAGATAIGAVNVTADLHGAALGIEVRTGDATTLPAAPWVQVANGGVPAVAPGDLLQYRLVVSGDGWQYPAIDKVSIDYAISSP